jgi:hypothetical protein
MGTGEKRLSRRTTPIIVSTCMGWGAAPDTVTDMLLRACQGRSHSITAINGWEGAETCHDNALCY